MKYLLAILILLFPAMLNAKSFTLIENVMSDDSPQTVYEKLKEKGWKYLNKSEMTDDEFESKFPKLGYGNQKWGMSDFFYKDDEYISFRFGVPSRTSSGLHSGGDKDAMVAINMTRFIENSELDTNEKYHIFANLINEQFNKIPTYSDEKISGIIISKNDSYLSVMVATPGSNKYNRVGTTTISLSTANKLIYKIAEEKVPGKVLSTTTKKNRVSANLKLSTAFKGFSGTTIFDDYDEDKMLELLVGKLEKESLATNKKTSLIDSLRHPTEVDGYKVYLKYPYYSEYTIYPNGE
ncbi:hypothetical protein BKP64_07120 [Marinobacter salinus]|uniref:Uncharacterized protein n=1 Tax=Marinobacter salinus TaxID=1874317 RepID=A0A1D9GK39_9GAMM|nr:hypothetical protein [Marinobacter salinus]AOY87959.1 hypothetical protein BKP64_07120 [Marinobacter salinus]